MNNPTRLLQMKMILRSALLVFMFLFGTLQTQAQCDPDLDTPALICHQGLNVSLPITMPMILWPTDFIENAWDLCDGTDLDYTVALLGDPLMENLPVDCSHIGNQVVEVQVTDQSGNSVGCQVDLIIEDKIGPVMVCDAEVVVTLETPGPTILNPEDITEGVIFDNCSSVDFTIAFFGETPATEIVLDCADTGDHVVVVTGTDQSGNENSCWAELTILGNAAVCDEVTVTGNVFHDDNEDCIADSGEMGIAIFDIEILNHQSGSVLQIPIDPSGNYATTLWFEPGIGNADVTITPLNVPGFMLPCGSSYTLPAPAGGGSIVQDIPVLLAGDCPYLQTDMGTNALRPCMSSTYTINFCSYTAELVANAFLIVEIDPLLTVTGSSIPWSSVNGNLYTFDVGDLDPASCDAFTITVDVSCDVTLGQTLCTTATIYPSELCAPVDPDYSGASIWAESFCDGDKVVFRLTNIGDAPMAESQDYLVVEDVIMYMSVPVGLDPGEEVEIEVPANGSTWRLEGPNEVLYPGQYEPIAWLEGCGGINTTGLVNLFPTNINEPFRTTFCLEVTGSFDPNDKTGFPYGLEAEHYILPNQDIDYLIRFQNTGTDTAFLVYILDTLDQNFLPGSVRPGASSHPYEFESLGNGVVKFTFENILLPDSTTNLEGSQGFVKLKLSQRPDLADGTVLHNSAAIYFDFNDPVITNETWHEIRTGYFSGLQLIEDAIGMLEVYPNPTTDAFRISLQNDWSGKVQALVVNLQGQVVQSQSFYKSGEEWSTDLSIASLANGVYFLVLTDGRQMIQQRVIKQ